MRCTVSFKKKLIVSLLVLVITLTGCGAPGDTTAGLEAAFNSRVAANIEKIKEIVDSGLISEEVGEYIKKGMQNNADEAVVSLNSVGSSIPKELRAIVGWRCVTISQFNSTYSGDDPYSIEETELTNKFLTNWVSEEYVKDSSNKLANLHIPAITDDEIVPINLLSQENAEAFNNAFSYYIYVLRTPSDYGSVSFGESTVYDLATIQKAIRALNSAEITESEKSRILNQFFTPLLDDNGEKVPLIDTSDPDYKIIRETSGVVTSNNKVRSKVGVDSFSTLKLSSSTNKLGRDLVYNHLGQDVLILRLSEINPDAYERIRNKVGINENAYLCVGGSSRAAYLLQYPVGYVSGYQLSSDKNKWEAVVENTNTLYLNVGTGAVYKRVVYGDNQVYFAKLNEEDAYIKNLNESPDSSSFVINGDTSDWGLEFGPEGKEVEADLPRIILRDYLEASYSPGVITNQVVIGGSTINEEQNVVVYGRKIRLAALSGQMSVNGELMSDSPIGYYMDISDETPTINENTKVYIGDLADITKMTSRVTNSSGEVTPANDRLKYPYKAVLPTSTGSVVATASEIREVETDLQNYEKAGSAEDLRVVTVDKITTTLPFPGRELNFADMDEPKDGVEPSDWVTTRPLFYAMMVGGSFTDTGLFNYMISDNVSGGSTAWWNKWLKNHNFSYNINGTSMLDYLKEDYTFELSEQGYLLVDTDTITQIQEDINTENKLGIVRFIRAIFKVLGYGLIMFGILLLLAWVFDVNFDLGIGVMTKLTFGSMIAISDASQLPVRTEEKVRYVDISGLAMVWFTMTMIGIALIYIDIISIVAIVIDLFGGIAKSISNIIK